MTHPVAETARRMLTRPDGDVSDVNHLLKVYGYAKTIGQLEGLDAATQEILEVAALVHDIACPALRAQFGRAEGTRQQIVGEPMARELLEGVGLSDAAIDRVAFLVAHHHTLEGVDSPDWQILLEADYLVNADESGYPTEAIQNTLAVMYKTCSGSELLRAIYRL